MEETRKISVEKCCIFYSIETTFVQQLDEHGLIELERSGNDIFITFEQLPELEKYMRLHYELHINMEGMHAVKHLLNQIETLQRDMKRIHGERP